MTELIENAGINYEEKMRKKLKALPGADGEPLLHKNWKQSSKQPFDAMFKHDGVQHPLEVKKDATADFGQITVDHSPEKGFHLSDVARKGKEHMAAHIEKSGILERLNGHPDFNRFAAGVPTIQSHPEIIHHVPGADHVNDYYNHDKGVPYIHVGGKGMYHTGDNPANLNTDKLTCNVGTIRARIKNRGPKQRPKVSISFGLHQPGINMAKSRVSLDATPETIKEEYHMGDLQERNVRNQQPIDATAAEKAADRLRAAGYIVTRQQSGKLQVQGPHGTHTIHHKLAGSYLRQHGQLNEYNIHTPMVLTS